jgi:hypothetical protein
MPVLVLKTLNVTRFLLGFLFLLFSFLKLNLTFYKDGEIIEQDRTVWLKIVAETDFLFLLRPNRFLVSFCMSVVMFKLFRTSLI